MDNAGGSNHAGVRCPGEPLVTAAELAELLGLSPATVLDRWERGDLPGYRLFGRKGGPVRFRVSEIEALLGDWRAGAGGEAPTAPQRPPALVSVLPTAPHQGGEHA